MYQARRKKRKPIYDPETGVPPTEEQIAKMRKQAMNVIAYWLNQGDQPRKKMYDKLVDGKGIIPEVADKILDEMEEKGYIDDQRYAENFVESKMRYEKLGAFAIKQKLSLKGIPKDIIDEVTSNIEVEEQEENAMELARKRIYPTRNMEPQKRLQNIAAYLVRRGYNGGVAFRVAKDALTEAKEETENEYYEE
jgi:regulatory protein